MIFFLAALSRLENTSCRVFFASSRLAAEISLLYFLEVFFIFSKVVEFATRLRRFCLAALMAYLVFGMTSRLVNFRIFVGTKNSTVYLSLLYKNLFSILYD